jgi:hypothetical protein
VHILAETGTRLGSREFELGAFGGSELDRTPLTRVGFPVPCHGVPPHGQINSEGIGGCRSHLHDPTAAFRER